MKTLLTFLAVLSCVFSTAQNILIQDSMPASYYPNGRFRNDVHIDAANNYWIAFDLIGLAKFDGNTWTKYDMQTGTLPSDKVYCVTSDSVNNIYAGTSDGLSVFNGTSWQHYNSGNSPLTSGAITVEVIGSDIWMGTNNGLFHFDGLNWTNYDQLNSGIISDSVTCITTGKNGEVWVGTKQGISKFYQNSWTNYGTSFQLPHLYIKDMSVNGNNELWVIDNAQTVSYLDNSSNYFSLFSSVGKLLLYIINFISFVSLLKNKLSSSNLFINASTFA